jgi:monoamine oxidase
MKRVAIIGAGCAGLAAAQTLLDRDKGDIEVVLIDALDRLGGRALTDCSLGFSFDLGPQYIQDPGINPWLKIAGDLKFDTLAAQPNTIYRVFKKGVWMDLEFPPDGVQAVRDLLDQSYNDNKTVNNAPPIQQCLAVNEDTCLALGSDYYGSIGESVEPWKYIAKDRARQITPDNAGEGVVYVNRGLGTLVEAFGQHLQKEYPGRLTTKTGKVVTCVHWDSNKRKLEVLAGNESLCIVEYCIVSVPCSAVPRIAFIPPLNQERVVANGYIELGSYKKIAFKPETMPDKIKAGKKVDEYYYVNEYFLYDEDMKGCWQYFRLPTAPDVLIGVASGNFAARLDKIDAKKAALAFIRALEKSYGPIVVTNAFVTNWSNDQHIWGAYSYTRYDGGDPNNPTAFDARVEIGEPHAEGHILFAGEATWTAAYGTIHGAYFSGERAANEILSSIGLSDITISI